MTVGIRLYETTIGKKIVMAVTGVIWVGYLVTHMLGNLQIFAGPETINAYSAFLHDTPALLWSARLVLLVAIVAHIVASIQLTKRNLDARAVEYKRRTDVVTSYAARTMVWSGPILLAFVIYHVLHLTLHVTPDYELDPHDVYNNVVYGFQIPWLAGFYIACQAILGFHLYHGVWSFFQTVGANHPRYNPMRRTLATLVAVGIVVGFVSVPISVMAGIVKPAPTMAQVGENR